MFSLFFVVMVDMSCSLFLCIVCLLVLIGVPLVRVWYFLVFDLVIFVLFCLDSSFHLHMLWWVGCRSLVISMRFQVLYCCSICCPLWLGWFGMLLLFSVLFLLCDFPLFLYYSWFHPDIYMFVHIPVRYFPGIEVKWWKKWNDGVVGLLCAHCLG